MVVRERRVEDDARRELVPAPLGEDTALAHDHGVETYGYRLSAGGFTAGHVVDTYWMDALPHAYSGVDLLLGNTTRERGRDRKYLHLGADDAELLVGEIRPRLAVLTHLGMQLARGRAEELALAISGRTGVPTLAARDGWLLDLDDLAGAAARRPAPRRPRRTEAPE